MKDLGKYYSIIYLVNLILHTSNQDCALCFYKAIFLAYILH